MGIGLGLLVILISSIVAGILESSGVTLHPAYWYLWGSTAMAVGIIIMVLLLDNKED